MEVGWRYQNFQFQTNDVARQWVNDVSFEKNFQLSEHNKVPQIPHNVFERDQTKLPSTQRKRIQITEKNVKKKRIPSRLRSTKARYKNSLRMLGSWRFSFDAKDTLLLLDKILFKFERKLFFSVCALITFSSQLWYGQ